MIDKGKLGPFVLEQRLGPQKTGTVYHAVHLQRRRAMAVRLMTQHLGVSGTSVAEFAREVEFLKSLEHPNVVRVFGGGVFDDEAYIAMELVQGQSLEEVLRRGGQMPWETVIEYAAQACAGLEYAHQRGAIHQNLTPAKLLLTDDDKIKITDFRGNRLNEYDRWNDVEPRAAAVAYMAPEQLRGEKSVTAKTDLYSLGCVMHHLLTGQQPFTGRTVAELKERHLGDVPPRISSTAFDCPIWLEALVNQMMEKDPARRPHFASSVGVALEEIKQRALGGGGIVEHAVTGAASALKAPDGHSEVRRLLKRKSTGRKKNEWVPFYERAWFLGLCAVLVVGLVTWAFWPVSEEKLFAQAETLLASEDRVDWQRARDDYLEPLLARFPNGQYAAQAKEHVDRIDMNQALVRIENYLRLNRTPKNETERLYAEAHQLEVEESERELALEKYQALVADASDQGDDRPLVLLARQRIADLEERIAAAAAAHQAREAAALAESPAPPPPTDASEVSPAAAPTAAVPAATTLPPEPPKNDETSGS